MEDIDRIPALQGTIWTETVADCKALDSMAVAKKPSRFHIIMFPLILAAAVFVIVDIEFPRAGLVRIDRADHYLADLRATMN